MIENVLEIKDTHVREVMTPLVDVVAIDAIATLIDFKNLWETHQYSRYCQLWLDKCIFKSCDWHLLFIISRVPVFEERIDNIVGIAYAMDMLEYVEEVRLLFSISCRNLITVTLICFDDVFLKEKKIKDAFCYWRLKSWRKSLLRKSHICLHTLFQVIISNVFESRPHDKLKTVHLSAFYRIECFPMNL